MLDGKDNAPPTENARNGDLVEPCGQSSLSGNTADKAQAHTTSNRLRNASEQCLSIMMTEKEKLGARRWVNLRERLVRKQRIQFHPHLLPSASSTMPFDCRFALIGYVRDRIRQRYYQPPGCRKGGGPATDWA